ncbi:aminotransferase class I/II-fold pyridoxal phosphate-dependent enzyme [Geofilum rubicundum]|uniref:L-threonine 3-O-phosphate decarboxylase n=1 Tax=Geofilum rubicundum JCM 15548 TaxID=1236989 RepID=A0A0E9LSF1_9BACT|nr:aminotransferase class I/II-fold pyridoxal phosphate-dependent enzyme [Geofilum rubicundum]GAO28071.1 L-threonine 3-O-phosphate decarboxylase [Geofilum rubicundum JCM 15548]
MLHGHGNDLHHQRFEIKADFSSNVVPGGMPEALKEYLADQLHLLENYPESDAAGAALAIARHHVIDPVQVIATNGSTEAFYLVAQLFREQASLILTPSFAEYEDAARCHRHRLTFWSHQQLKSRRTDDFNAVCSPTPTTPMAVPGNPRPLRTCVHKTPKPISSLMNLTPIFVPPPNRSSKHPCPPT